MPFPNFLILGPHKTGSTSLYYYLSQHPEIYMSPVKEPGFFYLEGEEIPEFQIARNMKGQKFNRLEDYLELFKEVKDEKAIGEASANYFKTAKATRRIKHYIPDVKMIATLRNPVDRAYSLYLMNRKLGYELAPDFKTAVEWDRAGNTKGWIEGCPWGRGYLEFHYAENIKRYFQSFDRSQFLFILYDDYIRSNLEILKDIFLFLGVDPDFKPDVGTQHNVASEVVLPGVNRVLNFPGIIKPLIRWIPNEVRRPVREYLKARLRVTPSRLDPIFKAELLDYFRDDILETQDILGIDLTSWFDEQ